MKIYKRLIANTTDIIYNDSKNMIYVQSRGGRLIVICNTLDQVEQTHQRMHKQGNLLTNIEEWDKDKDRKYILTFDVDTDQQPIYN